MISGVSVLAVVRTVPTGGARQTCSFLSPLFQCQKGQRTASFSHTRGLSQQRDYRRAMSQVCFLISVKGRDTLLWVRVRSACVHVSTLGCACCVPPFSLLSSDLSFKTNVRNSLPRAPPCLPGPLQKTQSTRAPPHPLLCIYIDGNILYILYHCAYNFATLYKP